MTLHWWMHWFWVTTQFLVILGNPVPSSTTEPRGQVQDRPSTEPPTSELPSVDAEGYYRTPIPRQNFRVAKAIGLYSQTNTAVILDRQVTTIDGPMERGSTVEASTTVIVEGPQGNSTNNVNVESTRQPTFQRAMESVERIRGPVAKKDSKIARTLTTNKSGRSKYSQEDKVLDAGRNISAEEVEDLTVLPLQEEAPKLRLVLNKTRPLSSLLPSSSLSSSIGQASGTGIKTFNHSSGDDVEIDDEDLVKPRLFATAASILEVGVSESTRLSRARSAFPKDFQRDQVQGEDRPLDYNDSSLADSSEGAGTSRSAVDIAAITGSCLATIVLLSTMGSLGFIMYRRRYLNPPQTLNSDKCSNPDSSGYIDDSTIRDNSEEMYSLDNDSFLNSLEAMTIQNYWTDSVKHTKL